MVGCVLGLGGCLVGKWLAAAIPSALAWALAGAGGAELVDGRFGPDLVVPNEAPWLLHAAKEFGTLLAHFVGFLTALWLARRLGSGQSLLATSLAVGLAAPVCLELLRYAWFRRSALELLVQSLGMPAGPQPVRQAVAVVATAGIVLLFRAALRRAAIAPLSALAVPACLVYAVSPESRIEFRFLEIAWLGYIPAFIAVAAALAASWPPHSWRAPPNALAAAAAVAGVLAWVAPFPDPTADRSVEWAEESSRNWQGRFEATAFPAQRRALWLAGAEQRLETYGERLGLTREGPPIALYVSASERALASVSGTRAPATSFIVESLSGTATMGTADNQPEDPRIEPLLAMRREWGETGSAAMALALARYAIGEFRNQSLLEAGSRVACEEQRYPAQAVFAVDGRFLSPLVRDTVGGAWVENAVALHGRSVLEKLYKRRLPESLALCEDCVPKCEARFATEVAPRLAPAYLKGISFSHEMRGGGYGSLAASRELGKIRDLGSNAVALVPYAFTGAPEEPSIRFRTIEINARLVRAARRAHELGLRVMLKPHLWAGRRFHGAIEFQNKPRFETWFGDYSRWMLHYARLAEMHRVDVLAIGNELAGLTVHEDEWRTLIRDVRRIYQGPLTYAAHWESELARIAFWDDLDYIGVNFYFPIAGRRELPEADSAEMERASRTIKTVQARFAKPLLFTEVGFPAVATAAARPWEENASALDPELQALCYQTWLERFAREPGVNGMFWWKWPSHGRGSPFDPSHRPLAKPAMEVLREWFGRL